MRFCVAKDQLVNMLTEVKAPVGRGSFETAQGILIRVEGDRVFFRATDLETDIEVGTHAKEGSTEDGTVLVGGKVLLDLARKLPNGYVEITGSDQAVTVAAGKSRIQLTKMDERAFPAPPAVGSTSVRLNAELLQELIRRTVPFVSRDSERVWLMGVHFKLREGKLQAIATDGVQVSCAVAQVEGAGDTAFEVTIGAKSLRDLLPLLEGAGTVTVHFSEGQALFNFSPIMRKVAVRLLDGQYPDVLRLLPQAYAHQFTFSVDDFLGALERASVVSGKSGVKLVLETGEDGTGFGRIEANQAEVGAAFEEVNVIRSQGGLTIAFNEAFLATGIKAVAASDKEFTIEMTGPRNPARMQSAVAVGGAMLQHSYVLLPLIML